MSDARAALLADLTSCGFKSPHIDHIEFGLVARVEIELQDSLNKTREKCSRLMALRPKGFNGGRRPHTYPDPICHPTTCYLLFDTYYLIPTTSYLLPTTSYLQLTSYYVLPTTRSTCYQTLPSYLTPLHPTPNTQPSHPTSPFPTQHTSLTMHAYIHTSLTMHAYISHRAYIHTSLSTNTQHPLSPGVGHPPGNLGHWTSQSPTARPRCPHSR